jgi:hypothetical protein
MMVEWSLRMYDDVKSRGWAGNSSSSPSDEGRKNGVANAAGRSVSGSLLANTSLLLLKAG